MCAKSSVLLPRDFGSFDYGAGGRLCTARVMYEELAVQCSQSLERWVWLPCIGDIVIWRCWKSLESIG
jgi:hypothetical protein